MSREMIKVEFLNRLKTMHGKSLEETGNKERFQAVCSMVRSEIGEKWLQARQAENTQKQVYYLSIEFLLGRLLGMHLVNLDRYDVYTEALAELGISLEELEAQEEDPGLGNGGLGRLAACYLDSMAALGLAGHGCCIRYRYGFFEQKVINGYQVEMPDNWLEDGCFWEFRRTEEAVQVRFGGTIREFYEGRLRYLHENCETVTAIPYDIPVLGFHNETVNTLRVWKAEPVSGDLLCSIGDTRDCLATVDHKHAIERISGVLYPDDNSEDGKMLRLRQQYFLVSASLQHIINQYRQKKMSLYALADHIAIHINDTHPALAVPELMRILLDEEGMGWEEAWQLTVNTLSYTNHTVLPEALEKWPTGMMRQILPRIYMISNEINERFCRNVWDRYPGQWELIRNLAIIADEHVNMANLAIVGSHSVNGVAPIHTEILKTNVMRNLYEVFPAKFNNKTNGISHRRWLLKANPRLAKLLNEVIGEEWLDHPAELEKILAYENDAAFRDKLQEVKNQNKSRLARYVKERYGISVDTHSIFDAHIKRIHGYKRQTMNAFHIMYLYNQLRENPQMECIPRTFIFAGKAAPGYQQAKRTIKWITALAGKINADTSIKNKLRVVFLENYNVSLAELIIPGTDVSEQIPTASREACGTGNMKFMMNGAITLGTMDGANIEISRAVGSNNIVTFGLSAQQVLDYYQHGGYNAWDYYHGDMRLRTVLDQLVNGFLPVSADEFRPLFEAFLFRNDEFFVLRDFDAYAAAQKKIENLYRDSAVWLSMALRNIAHSGIFSGDRTFMEYSRQIWKTDSGAGRDQLQSWREFWQRNIPDNAVVQDTLH